MITKRNNETESDTMIIRRNDINTEPTRVAEGSDECGCDRCSRQAVNAYDRAAQLAHEKALFIARKGLDN